jgi:hypothetical protein
MNRQQFKHWLVFAAAALMAFRLAAADDAGGNTRSLPAPKRVVIPKLRGAVTLDGELKESVWKKAAVLTPFAKNDGSGPERERTELRIWYNAKALYLGWTCYDSDIQATFTARDSHFWEEEVVEFFVTPNEVGRYFELEWNPLGGMFDAIITNQLSAQGVSTNFNGDWSFTAKGMRCAPKVHGTLNNSKDQDQSWQVEVMIPFADLGVVPKRGDVWRGNFYRFNRGEGHPVEELSWSPNVWPGFHQPSRFGYLEFGR